MSSELPLQGKRILLTRAKSQVKGFIDKINAAGGEALTAPLLEFKANDKNKRLIKETILSIRKYDCIVFTSANGANFFQHYLDLWEVPYKNLNHLVAASVGSKTSKRMKKLGLHVTIIPEEFVAEKLVEKIAQHVDPGANVLVIRGNLAKPTLVNGLEEKGYNVMDLVVYETIHNMKEAEKLKKYVLSGEIDYITFTSSSTVDSFMEILKQESLAESLKKVTFICIGPITNNTLIKYGYVGIMPDSYTIEDMVKLMIKHGMERKDT